MTLSEVAMGTPARIVGFRALTPAQRARLGGMGLREDLLVTKVLKTPLRDPVECLAGSQLLALERWLLEHIVVAP